jgi:hypothetical protein
MSLFTFFVSGLYVFIVNGRGQYLNTYKKVKRLHNTKKGVNRQGIHTVWRNYVSKWKKKRKGTLSMLQAPVLLTTKRK